MSRAEVVLTGDRALVADLRRLDHATRGPLMVRAAQAACLPAVNLAKTMAPYRTGNLRRSIHVGGVSLGLESPTTGTDIGGATTTRTTVEVAFGTNVEYASAVEFGTSRLAPRPYLRPAVAMAAADMRAALVQATRALLRAVV